MCVKTYDLRSPRGGFFWNESRFEENPSFVGFIQWYTDKTEPTLKANGIVAYPDLLVSITFSNVFWQYLVYHAHTEVGLLPVSALELSNKFDDIESRAEKSVVPPLKEPLTNSLPTTSTKDSEVVKTEILHEAIRKKLELLSSKSPSRFPAAVVGKKWSSYSGLLRLRYFKG